MQRVHLRGPLACSAISPLFPPWMRLSGDRGPRAAIHCSWHYQPKLIVHYLLLSKLCPLPPSLSSLFYAQFQPPPPAPLPQCAAATCVRASQPPSRALLTEPGLFFVPDALWMYFQIAFFVFSDRRSFDEATDLPRNPQKFHLMALFSFLLGWSNRACFMYAGHPGCGTDACAFPSLPVPGHRETDRNSDKMK